MRIVSPGWLWVLALFPLFYYLIVFEQKKKKETLGFFAHSSVWKKIIPELDWGAQFRKRWIWLLSMGFILLSLARPQWGKHDEVVHVTGLDIVVVLDVSNSMWVEDVVPSRLKKAKHVLRTLFNQLSGDRVGIIAFAGSSYLACPLTTDLGYASETLEILNPNMILNQGTDIGIGLETAVRALDRAAEEATGSEVQNSSTRVVLLISDGENHEERAVGAAKKVLDSGARLYVLGVGTETGGPIPIRDESGALHGYKKDRRGNSIVSGFKPQALMEIASTAQGRYWNVTSEELEVDELVKDLGSLARGEYAERRYVVYEERFQIPLAIGVMLVFFELSLPARILLLMMSLVSGLLISPVQASSLDTYLENESGIKALQKGDVEAAKKKFGSAQARDPNSPELQFNHGLIKMAEGDPEGAAEEFKSVARKALKNGNADLAGKSYFNLGEALVKKGDTKSATQAYLQSIDAAKATHDEELEKDVRKNLELMLRKKKQNKSGGENKKNQQQQDQSNNQNQQNQNENQGQNKNKNYANKREEFKSPKLSKEDAQRVMAELSNKEKDLQARLRKQKGKSIQNEKDW